MSSLDPICDFCSDPDVRWAYDADDFVMGSLGGVTHTSVGAWAACQTCHDLIEAGELQKLTERSFAQYEPLFGVTKELRDTLTEMHKRFARAQRGEARPL